MVRAVAALRALAVSSVMHLTAEAGNSDEDNIARAKTIVRKIWPQDGWAWRPDQHELIPSDPHTASVLVDIRHPAAQIPVRPHDGDAGFDLFVCEDVTIQPGTFCDVRTGIAIALPEGYFARIVGRSSTIRRRKLLATEGIIDSGFRGELFSAVWNMDTQPVTVRAGERISQLIIQKIVAPRWVELADGELPDSSRGELGFGSSGT